ncbi:MAG: hypothetical protein ACRCZF_20200, partial [Gemmataceae bacterium]
MTQRLMVMARGQQTAAGPEVVERSPGFTLADEDFVRKQASLWANAAGPVPEPGAVWLIDGPTAGLLALVWLPPGPLGPFRCAIGPRETFDWLGPLPGEWLRTGPIGDADRFPSDLPLQIDQLHETMKTADGPLVYGMVQSLLDGHPIRLLQAEPLTEWAMVWALLPLAERLSMRFATWSPVELPGVRVVVGPTLAPGQGMDAERLRDYPAGRYETAMQLAIENRDAESYATLLARRTSADVLRTAITMLLLAVLIACIWKF